MRRVTSRPAEVRAAYEGFLADFDQNAAMLHPDVEWQTSWPGLAPAVHGVEGVRRWMVEFRAPWEWLEIDVREIIEVDEETVFVWNHLHARGKGSGVDVEVDNYDVLTFRDGQVVLRRTWPDRAMAVATAGIASEV
jgi:ketosteroid isomerase-like protein